MVVLDNEIGSAILLNSIWMKCFPGFDSTSTFQDLGIYMGLAGNDSLGPDFLENYLQGSRSLVLGADSFTVAAGPNDWFEIPLDSAYWYNGIDNLLIEFEWSGGTSSVYDWQWLAGDRRALFSGGYSRFPEGDTFESLVPCLRLDGIPDPEPEVSTPADSADIGE